MMNLAQNWWYRTRRNMKTKTLLWIIGFVIIGIIIIIWASSSKDDATVKTYAETSPAPWNSNKQVVATTAKTPTVPKVETTVICVVACGKDKYDEALVMIKSALVYSRKPLMFIVITEYKLIPAFHEKLEEWKQISNKTFDFSIRPVAYPTSINETEWKILFKPCASLRLFLPDILHDIDSILYVDTDVLFLSKPGKVWRFFDFFNESQFAALVPECEDTNACWYPRFAKHPYIGLYGLNSGVMLMNLTRMRQFRWTSYLEPIYKKWQHSITWGDQDIINIIFNYHPEGLFLMDCRFNYRPDHCMYSPICKEATKKNGALILHGSRGVFHNKKQPPFYAAYLAMSRYQFHQDPFHYLVTPMQQSVLQEDDSKCSKAWKHFIARPLMNFGKSVLTDEYHAEEDYYS